MGLDIGLKRIQAAEAVQRIAAQRQLVECHWSCDLVTAWSIGEVIPTVDTTMLRIYSDVYNKDINYLNEEQLQRLATACTQPITVFIYQQLFRAICRIAQRWRTLGSLDKNFMFSITTNALTMFQNLLTLHKQHPDADDTLEFNSFKSSLLRNSEEWFLEPWHEDFDISKYYIPQEQFIAFMDIVDKKIQQCFSKSNPNDTIAVDYSTKIQSVIEYLKTLLLIVHQAKIESKEDVLKLKTFAFNYQCVDSESRQLATQFATKYGNLTITQLLCLSTDTQITLPVEQANGAKRDKFETLYAYTKYIQNHIRQEETEP